TRRRRHHFRAGCGRRSRDGGQSSRLFRHRVAAEPSRAGVRAAHGRGVARARLRLGTDRAAQSRRGDPVRTGGSRPLVARIELKKGLLSSVDDPDAARLLGGRCGGCGRLNFPAQDICPYCSADRCQTVALSPRGVVEVCTTVINRPPGYEGAVPFGFGVVELPEGIRIITRISDPQRVRQGTAVRLVIEPLCTDAEGGEVMTYAFEPAET